MFTYYNGFVGWFGLAVRRWAGKQKDLGSIRLSLPSEKVVVCGHCLVTLSITIYNSITIISLFPQLHTPFSPVSVPNKPYGFCGR